MARTEARRHPHDTITTLLEGHRRELRTHCQRLLGSAFEAEDAVQETLVRAWRAYDRFDGRSSLRTWLYRIATNVCFSMARGPQRRARPVDLDATVVDLPFYGQTAGDPIAADPADVVTTGDAVRRAFVVALQSLPPRQRAALILQDVLRWKASEVAELLGSTEPAIRSAVQRARTTLAANAAQAADGPPAGTPSSDPDPAQLTRYVAAFERTDVKTLVALLQADHVSAA